MSDTTTNTTPTLKTPAGLTGSLAAIHTALVNLTEDVTSAELALAARVGRSTAGKALTTLEQRNLAIRTPGGHDGPRRNPDLWRAALTPATTDSPEPVGNDANHADADTQTAPETPTTPNDGEDAAATHSPTTEAPQHEPPHDVEHAEGVDSGKDTSHTEHSNNYSKAEDGTPAAQASGDRQTTPAEPTRVPGEKKRLAPGGLRQMVIEHLRAHPGEAFTATRISRVIEKSSGAIANALVTLTQQGIAEQVDERPRTYRLATPQDNR